MMGLHLPELKVWRLRSYLSALLVTALLIAFGAVGSVILLIRIPQLESYNRADVVNDVGDVTERVELLLNSLESRMQLLSEALEALPEAKVTTLLDRAAWDGLSFRAIYLASNQGTILAAGVAPALRVNRADLVGSDISAIPLFRAAQASRQTVWADKYLSSLSGVVTVGVAYPVGRDRILLAEVPLEYLLSAMRLATGHHTSLIWLVDRAGEIVADTDGGKNVGAANVLKLPIFQAALANQPLPELFTFEGRNYYPAVSRLAALDWHFIGGLPAGLQNNEIRGAVLFVIQGFVGSLLVGLLMAPFWASWLVRPLRGIVERAGQITQGNAQPGDWPKGAIVEFNHLSGDMERMANTLQEREKKFLAIFNTSPIPMSVTDVDRQFVLLDVNEAWCRTFDRRREDVLGKTVIDIGMLRSADNRTAALAQMQGDSIMTESRLFRSDGQEIECQTYGRVTQIGTSKLMIWATVDVGDMRRISRELKELNVELEARVARRTQALAALNEELSDTVTHLRETQGELVRVEKMAALGGLVAGVAHELNTPLGNGLMAVTALAAEAREFKASMQEGLRRAALDGLLASVEQATNIATRNLHRAAGLVTSFKQVAVDQTSSQRRHFELGEVVDEMVVSLRPTFSRTPYQIAVQVPKGLMLDSYPGALGQAIGNLITNAVLHGFEGRTHGTVCISGERGEDGGIVLHVADDGKGIAADLLERIFDPFVTTKMGRGGTGLGLHIAYNAVVNLLGGRLTVHSVVGKGATFTLHLPDKAPRVSEVAQAG
jgi:PAS domain S-box-containing protein